MPPAPLITVYLTHWRNYNVMLNRPNKKSCLEMILNKREQLSKIENMPQFKQKKLSLSEYSQ